MCKLLDRISIHANVPSHAIIFRNNLYKSPSPTYPSHSDCNPITVLTQESASLEETCAHITINERATTTFISVIQHVCKGCTTVCIQLNFEKKQLVFVREHDIKICTSFKIFQYYHILSAKATKSLGLNTISCIAYNTKKSRENSKSKAKLVAFHLTYAWSTLLQYKHMSSHLTKLINLANICYCSYLCLFSNLPITIFFDQS